MTTPVVEPALDEALDFQPPCCVPWCSREAAWVVAVRKDCECPPVEELFRQEHKDRLLAVFARLGQLRCSVCDLPVYVTKVIRL